MQASSGFRGSGANLMNDIFGQQSNALGNQSADFGMMGMQNRQNALAQLLGLNQSMTNTNTGLASQQVGVAGQLAGMGQQQGQADQAQKNTEFNFGDFMMSLAGKGGGAAAAYYGANGFGGGGGGGTTPQTHSQFGYG